MAKKQKTGKQIQFELPHDFDLRLYKHQSRLALLGVYKSKSQLILELAQRQLLIEESK